MYPYNPYIVVRHNIPDLIFLASMHVNTVMQKNCFDHYFAMCYMLNTGIHKSKKTVLISIISILVSCNFAQLCIIYTVAASLLASRGLEAQGRTSRGRGQYPQGPRTSEDRSRKPVVACFSLLSIHQVRLGFSIKVNS